MTSNKEFISQIKENLNKTDSAKAPQFNPEDRSFRKLLGIKEDNTIPLSIARVILYAQIRDKKNIMTVNNPTNVWKKSITFKH
jgi:hypothetical protein